MRSNQLRKNNSTKSERQIGEILKKNKIKFKAKWRIGKYQVDFLIGRVVIEVDGSVHKNTNREKDIYLFSKGFIPLHISVSSVKMIEKEIISLIRINNKHGKGYRHLY